MARARTAALAAAVVVPAWLCLFSVFSHAAGRPLARPAAPPPGAGEAAAPQRSTSQFGEQRLQQSLVPKRPAVQRPAYQPVIDDVERGIASGSVAEFAAHFPSQVSITLRGGEGGTYSSSQAYYLLDQFFRLRRFTGCRLSTVGESGGVPFATGNATFTLKGARESAQVYLALVRSGDRWVISQINIY